MPFTLTHPLERPPTYLELLALAGTNGVQISGDEQAGVFAARGIEGKYRFDPNGDLRGEGTGFGVAGSFALVTGKAEIIITQKPFLLPEAFIKSKLLEGLQSFSANLRAS